MLFEQRDKILIRKTIHELQKPVKKNKNGCNLQ